MKSNIYKGKLHLSKQAIAALSSTGLENIKGGQARPMAWSTSIGKCSGIFCCDQYAPDPFPDVDYIYYNVSNL